jgi:hypothetical protein
VSAGGFGAFSALSIYKEDEQFYDNFLMPLTRMLDAETSHNYAIAACKYKLFPKSRFKDPETLVCVQMTAFTLFYGMAQIVENSCSWLGL